MNHTQAIYVQALQAGDMARALEIERNAQCVCDYDCDGERYARCNRSILCPEHDECSWCLESPAVAIVDGAKVCQNCKARAETIHCYHCGETKQTLADTAALDPSVQSWLALGVQHTSICCEIPAP